MNTFIIGALTASALNAISFATYADDDSLYIKQVGASQVSLTTQTGNSNTIRTVQNGGSEYSSITQNGTGNSFSNSEGQNLANNGYEASSAHEHINATQTGTSNVAGVTAIGLANTDSFGQTGSSNTLYLNQSDNHSTASIQQAGSHNYAGATQK